MKLPKELEFRLAGSPDDIVEAIGFYFKNTGGQTGVIGVSGGVGGTAEGTGEDTHEQRALEQVPQGRPAAAPACERGPPGLWVWLLRR